jgi:hypothetical protein
MTEKNENNIRHLNVREITLTDDDIVLSSLEKMILMVQNIRQEESQKIPKPLLPLPGPDME